MSVYVIKSYLHIASIPKHFLTKKGIAAKSSSKILDIYIPILLKKRVAEALKFWFFKVKYINQLSDLYINLKGKLVKFLWHFKKCLSQP